MVDSPEVNTNYPDLRVPILAIYSAGNDRDACNVFNRADRRSIQLADMVRRYGP
jgi:hypothetical protein